MSAFYTPLRYPGGKRRLTPVVMSLLEKSRLKNVEYVEPYAGGSAVALSLLFNEYASVVHINDLSRPVYAFWYAVLNETDALCRRVERSKVTMQSWLRQRRVYDRRKSAELVDLGFATLFLNRTNRSGILSGGVIGGKQQTGKWLLDARFNKRDLVQRIRRIARYRDRIRLYQQDALDFTNRVVSGLSNVFAFYDPPYIENGYKLYLNDYTIAGHRALATRIAQLNCPWVVTYDGAAVRERLYPLQRRLLYGLSYSAQGRHRGDEVMFLSDHLELPESWQRGEPIKLSGERRHVVYGRIDNMKPHAEMHEGQSAFEKFRRAVETIVSVPKSEMPVKGPKQAGKKETTSSRKN